MESIHHICDNCGSEFHIKYDSSQCEDDPNFCPFCAEIMIETDFDDDEDE
jgi:DNA replicative helicase MCM subunit Mcm2 (Cdc46/Mcm family)